MTKNKYRFSKETLPKIATICLYAGLLLMIVAIAGCNSTKQIVFDDEGKVESVTYDNSPVGSLIESLKHKTVIRFSNCWYGRVIITTTSTETGLPNVEFMAFKGIKLFATIREKHKIDNIAKLIKALNLPLKVSKDSIGE